VKQSASTHVPQSHGIVFIARRQGSAVQREGERGDTVIVQQFADLPSRCRIEQLDVAVDRSSRIAAACLSR
jgi:hypothetical protein